MEYLYILINPYAFISYYIVSRQWSTLIKPALISTRISWLWKLVIIIMTVGDDCDSVGDNAKLVTSGDPVGGGYHNSYFEQCAFPMRESLWTGHQDWTVFPVELLKRGNTHLLFQNWQSSWRLMQVPTQTKWIGLFAADSYSPGFRFSWISLGLLRFLLVNGAMPWLWSEKRHRFVTIFSAPLGTISLAISVLNHQ